MFSDKVVKLHRMIDAEAPERANLVVNSITWSKHDSPERKAGHPILHQKLAITFWKGNHHLKGQSQMWQFSFSPNQLKKTI